MTWSQYPYNTCHRFVFGIRFNFHCCSIVRFNSDNVWLKYWNKILIHYIIYNTYYLMRDFIFALVYTSRFFFYYLILDLNLRKMSTSIFMKIRPNNCNQCYKFSILIQIQESGICIFSLIKSHYKSQMEFQLTQIQNKFPVYFSCAPLFLFALKLKRAADKINGMIGRTGKNGDFLNDRYDSLDRIQLD